MINVFTDNFEDETIGQPPSQWTCSDNVTVQTDPINPPNKMVALQGLTPSATVWMYRDFMGVNELVEIKYRALIMDWQTQLVEVTPLRLIIFDTQTPLPHVLCQIDFVVIGDTYRRIRLWKGQSLYSNVGRFGRFDVSPPPPNCNEWDSGAWYNITVRCTYSSLYPMLAKRFEVLINNTVIYAFAFPLAENGTDKIARIQFETDKSLVYVDDVEVNYDAILVGDFWSAPNENIAIADLKSQDYNISAFQIGHDAAGMPAENKYSAQTAIANVKDDVLSHFWLSKMAGVNDETIALSIDKTDHIITIDLDEARYIDVFGVLAHNLGEYCWHVDAPRELILRAFNNADDYYKPAPFQLVLTEWFYRLNEKLKENYGGEDSFVGLTNMLVYPQKSYRYWQLVVRQYRCYKMGDNGGYKQTDTDYFKIGKIIISDLTEMPHNFSNPQVATLTCLDAANQSITGAQYRISYPLARKLNFHFELIDSSTEVVKDLILRVYHALKKSGKLIIFEPNDEYQGHIYGRFPIDFEFNFEKILLDKDIRNFNFEIEEEVW